MTCDISSAITPAKFLRLAASFFTSSIFAVKTLLEIKAEDINSVSFTNLFNKFASLSTVV
ncbi:hypothetical protein [Treponema pedis]|uniref:hypothetical protein n=1 Tax=Treponema pedis TaxID=409322 RepID=UPI000686E421|nr:hypothetical protein [Treponema pedis]